MTRRDDSLYIGHMLDTARQVRGLVEGKSRQDFDADLTLRLSLVHLIQTIGEAARLVSQPARDAAPEIP